MAIKGEIRIPKTWRSELSSVILFLALVGLAIFLTRTIPWATVTGDIFSIGDRKVIISLPVFFIFPFAVFSHILYKIYDVRYTISGKGIQARIGVLSFAQSVTNVRFEDIRSIETVQSLWERILGIGSLEISTAATGGVEISLDGIAAPADVQQALLIERDQRQRLQTQRDKEKESDQERINER